MHRIDDALELLTSQHEEIDELLATVSRSSDAKAFAVLADKLTIHLALEQELLYPLVSPMFSREIMTEVMAEHIVIKRALADLVWIGTDDAEFDHRFAGLAALVTGHTAWQEDQMFTTAAERMSQAELAGLNDRLHAFDDSFAVAA